MMRFALIGVAVLASAAAAQDMPLSQVLIPGEGWRAVAMKGTATCIAAGDGNLWVATSKDGIKGRSPFTARKIPKEVTVWKLTEDGPKAFAKVEMLMSMAWNPKGYLVTLEDGTLYRRATGAKPEIIDVPSGIRGLPAGASPVVADFVISHNGDIYWSCIISTGVTEYNCLMRPEGDGGAAKGQMTGAFAFWKDGGTLVVGDEKGDKLYAYRVGKDGGLDAKEGYYTLRRRDGQPSGVKALARDADGRLYAATALGVQVFDPTGRMCGVIPSPVRKPVTAMAFAGPGRDRLYVVCDGKLFVRKTKVKGFVAAKPATKPGPKGPG